MRIIIWLSFFFFSHELRSGNVLDRPRSSRLWRSQVAPQLAHPGMARDSFPGGSWEGGEGGIIIGDT